MTPRPASATAGPADSRTGMRFARFVERIAGKGSRAWDIHDRARALEAKGRDVIVLSIGDPDFDTPPPIVDEAAASLARGRTHYSSMVGIRELREAIAARHRRLTGQAVDAGAVVVTPGAQCGLFSAMMCLAEAGDEVIVPEPMYVTYEAVVGAAGARRVEVPLRGGRGFHLDPADVAAAITPRTRAILINFPHNPTGATITADELAGLAELCVRHDLWVISDEVYASLTYDAPHLSPASLPELADRTVVIDSMSKAYAMTGWRLGWVVAPGELPFHLANLAQCMLYGCPTFIQDAAAFALEREFAEIAAMTSAFRARRDLVVERVAAIPGLACVKPEGAMFVMIDVRGSGLGSLDFAHRLLEVEGVCLLPCDGFGPSGEGYLRLSLSAPVETLDAACDRLDRFTRALGG